MFIKYLPPHFIYSTTASSEMLKNNGNSQKNEYFSKQLIWVLKLKAKNLSLKRLFLVGLQCQNFHEIDYNITCVERSTNQPNRKCAVRPALLLRLKVSLSYTSLSCRSHSFISPVGMVSSRIIHGVKGKIIFTCTSLSVLRPNF